MPGMEAAVLDANSSMTAGQSSAARGDTLRLRLAPLAPTKDAIFDEVERRLQNLSRAAAAPAKSQQQPQPAAIPKPQAPPRVTIPRTAPRKPIARPAPVASDDLDDAPSMRAAIIAAVLVAAFGVGLIGGTMMSRLLTQRDVAGQAAINTVVARIIDAESSGVADAKNKRSSAAGLGQFIDETWLRMIHAYRPDLAKGLSRGETLALRQQADVAREMTTRFAERHAALLRRHALPVTAGTLYLAHFAGGKGAIALLTAPEDADAATVMAKADASGRTKRAQIVKANPFLEKLTVADLKQWADRKMAGADLQSAGLLAAANTK